MHARKLMLAWLFVVGALLLLSAQRTWRERPAFTGLTLVQGSAGALVESVAPASPAERAGLRAGDGVLEIGGHPVGAALVGRDLLSQARGGRSVGLVVRRDGRTETLRLQPEVRPVWRVERMLAWIVGALFWIAATAAVVRPRRCAATSVYVAWCLTGALVLGVTWSFRGDRLDWVLFWVDRAARLLLPALWLHLALALRRDPERRWLPVAYAPPLMLLLAEIHIVGLGGALRAADPVAFVDWLQGRAELGWMAVGLLGGLAVLTHSAICASGVDERARARWFLAGAALGLGPYLALSAAPQLVAGREPSFSGLATPFLAVLPLLFTSAVLDYRLMDLTLFLRRTITVAAAVAFSLVLFLGFYSLADLLLPTLLHPAGLAPALLAAVVTAALAPAIRAGAKDLVGRVFYRRRHSFRRALERVASDLNAERDLLRLCDVLERRVAEALDAGVVRLLLTGAGGALIEPFGGRPLTDALSPATLEALIRGETQTLAMLADAPNALAELNQAGVQALAPLRVEGQLIAVLAVGPRAGGPVFDTDDMDLLRSVAAHAAAAVAGALHLAELREQVTLVQRLQAHTEALINSSPIGLVVIDHAGQIRRWNPAVAQLLGVTREEALNRPCQEVLPLALRGPVREFARTVPLSGRSRAYRIQIGEDGPRGKLVDLSLSSLRGPDGVEGVLLTLDDVTERVRLEEQLIQQDRLASVGLLAAGVAHEVNTPLTGISSYAQLLLEDSAPDDPRRPMLEQIVQQAGRASQIARGLLRFSRPGPAAEMSWGAVDLRQMVEETVGLLAPQIRRASASVECRWNGASAMVLGDRSRLQQVIINLLLNALDAVRAPGGQITVRSGAEHDARVWLEVEDNGVGIAAEHRSRIFDPFFTTKKPGEGTGLGLSISYSIVREHGGTLTADGAPEQGAVMRMILPAAGGAVERAEPQVAVRRAG